MSIENAFRFQKFNNEFEKSATNIVATHHWLLDQLKNKVEQQGITLQQFFILQILASANQPLSVWHIRERLLDRMSDTSRVIDRMVLKELVSKSVSSMDRRMVEIMLTPKGIEKLNCLLGQGIEFEKILGKLNLSEAATLNLLLEKLWVKQHRKVI